jgi:very-short-patch-repair endonuclease
MFEGANHLVFELAKDLRKNMTDAERVLWMYLRSGINSLKFRRQHPIGIYIADFYCHKIKLIIEVDGLIHSRPETKEYDERRATDLITLGNHILRFTNKAIFTDIEKVLDEIEMKVQDLILKNNY